MDCAACATKIETAVRRLPGIQEAAVSVSSGTLAITHDSDSDGASVEKAVKGLGYSIAPLAARHDRSGEAAMPACCGGPACRRDADASHVHEHEHEHGHDHGHHHEPLAGAWWRTPKGVLAIACGLALIAAYGVGLLVPSLRHASFVAAMLVGLVPTARRAFAAARAGTPFSIEMLMTIAAIGAVFIGAAEEAAMVVFLFLVGELLEGVAAGRARASIEALTDLMPSTAMLERDGSLVEVPADTLTIGATILVRPGDRIAADGEIVSGESAINEASVTGESMPVGKRAGDAVFAGTINGDAALRVRVTAAAADNTIARIVRLVEEAQDSKAPTERLIDRFARYYTPGVVAVAALVAVAPPLLFGGVWSEWIYKGLAILLIGCPCALVISTPAAIAASLSSGARRGLLVKGGAVLETLGTITTVAFDKTGTLTEGRPVVTDVIGFDRPEADVLAFSAALEAGSSHPLAAAILARAAADGLKVAPAADARALKGKGVAGSVDGVDLLLASPQAAGERTALRPDQTERIAALHDQGKTVSVLVADERVAGLVAMRDEPRGDAKAAVETLTKAGIEAIMLTGDHARTAAAIAGDLGLEARAGLLPADKLRIVEALKARGRRVAKVGDGINDAPALATADVGIAMGGGTDVALETADAAILQERVMDVPRLIDLSRRTMRNIRQNIGIALGLKGVFLVTTLAGITGLWPAILADTGATVLVTANALRLLAPTPDTVRL